MTDHSPRHSAEPGDHGSEAAIPENVANWKQVAKILHEALPQIDEAIGQASVPVTDRRLQAFNIVQDTMLEVSDTKAFLLRRGARTVSCHHWRLVQSPLRRSWR